MTYLLRVTGSGISSVSRTPSLFGVGVRTRMSALALAIRALAVGVMSGANFP